MATPRIDMRIDDAVKAAAEKAAALKGMKNLTEYVVRLVEENAEQVISQHESITLCAMMYLTALSPPAMPQKRRIRGCVMR